MNKPLRSSIAEKSRVLLPPRSRGRQQGAAKVWLVVLLLVNGVVAAAALQLDLRQWLTALVPWERSSMPAPQSSEWTCAAWGPFAGPAGSKPTIEEIAAAGGSTDLVSRELAASPYYLVLVGPMGSFDAARRVREELGSLAIDSHIVPRGPFVRSLEAGVFPDRAKALAQQALIRELGYDTNLHEVQHPQTVYHVLARLRRKAAEDFPPAKDCGIVAPGHRFL